MSQLITTFKTRSNMKEGYDLDCRYIYQLLLFIYIACSFKIDSYHLADTPEVAESSVLKQGLILIESINIKQLNHFTPLLRYVYIEF